MKRIITLDNQNIQYTLKVSERARGVRLAIYHDGDFVVTVPKRVGENVAEDFILKKSRWILSKLEYFKKNPRTIFIKHTPKEIQEYKKQASTLVRIRIQHWNTFYNFKYNTITIKNVTSRWGSCSKKGNLNFNYKILFLPQELVDYIIVHELCHLREMNHSAEFWSIVAKTIPEYKELRKQLKMIQ